MHRVGIVASVDENEHLVRVTFPERDGDAGEDPESFDMQMAVQHAGDYSLPAVGAQVLCAIDDGPEGLGYVLGVIYKKGDAQKAGTKNDRVVAGDSVRLGSHEAEDPVALATKVKDELDALKQHFDTVEAILTGPAINEAGNGAPSSLQLALKLAIQGAPYPDPGDVGADLVVAK